MQKSGSMLYTAQVAKAWVEKALSSIGKRDLFTAKLPSFTNLRPKIYNLAVCLLVQQTITKLTASALNFNVLGAAIKAVVETVSALDGESHRCSAEKKFSLLYRMARYVS